MLLGRVGGLLEVEYKGGRFPIFNFNAKNEYKMLFPAINIILKCFWGGWAVYYKLNIRVGAFLISILMSKMSIKCHFQL